MPDYDDWDNLVYTGISDSDGIRLLREVIEETIILIDSPAGEYEPPIDEPLTPNQIPTLQPGN